MSATGGSGARAGMSAMGGLRLLLGKEMREQVRTMRFAVVVIVLAMFGGTSPLLAKALPDIVKMAGDQAGGLTITIPPPTVTDAIAQLVKNLGQFGVLIAILVSMGTVATEKERGTAGFVLTKPVGRGAFILAKAAAIAVLLAVGVAAGYALAWVYTAALFEALPLPGYLASGVVLWLSLLAIGGVTFVCSVLARSALVAGGAGFAALVVAMILAGIPAIGAWSPIGLLEPAAHLALGTDPGNVAGPAVLNVLLALGCVTVAAMAFRRQEL
jgi:ABC-2 type transport system permease protein